MTLAEVATTAAFSIGVAAVSTAVNVLPGVILAYFLARVPFRGKSLVEAFVALPLVVPPVAVGLLLLLLFSRRGPLGPLLDGLGIPIVFTWRGAAIAAAVMSFPLLVRSAEQAFVEVPGQQEDVARTLGAGPIRCFLRVSLPLAGRGIAYGILLAFLRALGEFGATNLLAGNIPGRTQTLSLGIYDAVLSSRDRDAFALASVSILLSLAAVLLGERFLRARRRR